MAQTPRGILLAIALLAPALAVSGASDGRDPDPAPTVPDFELEIVPLLTKAGCNSGQCHGAAGGQAGFALSLRGYDASADYDAIVRDRGGRRIDWVEADRSLLLRKPSLRMKHRGGRKLPVDGPGYDVVRRWVDAGAPRTTAPGGDPAARAVLGLVVDPPRTLGRLEDRVPLRVHARLASGERVDVTGSVLYSSNDESVARVDEGGVVTLVGPGETAILVRFPSAVASARVGVPFGPARPPRQPPPASRLDAIVEAKLAEMGIPVSPACDDASFVRRAWLDLAGRLPDLDAARAWSEPGSARDRGRLVLEILGTEAAAAHWTRWLADLCRVRAESMGENGARRLQAFLRDAIEQRRPLDEVVRELLTAQGRPGADGAAAYFLATPGPLQQMEMVTQTFQGMQLQCAQCHQHPFDRWSRDDYFGAASFFARVRRDGGRIVLADFGEFTDPRTGGDATARIPGSDPVEFEEGVDRRDVFARWLLDPDRLQFDRAIVNRLWKALFGRAIVEPVDDLRDGNPPSNPELLEWLAVRFRDGGRDLFALLREIASSEAYGRSVEPVAGNERDEKYGSRALVRPVAAPVLADALADVLGARIPFPDEPAVRRASEIADDDAGSFTLRALGRCPRDGSQDPATVPAPSVPSALHFVHGPIAGEWLSAGEGRVARIAARGVSDDAAVEELFLAALARRPTSDERKRAVESLQGPDRRARLEDLLWALIATTEFAMNH